MTCLEKVVAMEDLEDQGLVKWWSEQTAKAPHSELVKKKKKKRVLQTDSQSQSQGSGQTGRGSRSL